MIRFGQSARAAHNGAEKANDSVPTAGEIRSHLARVIGSTPFLGSIRLPRFLTFIVEQTLAGRAGRIKAYTVATEALGRGGDFDPQDDAIVRVAAGRLRHALARYYEGPGCDDPLVIEIPRGTYVPTFRRRRSNQTQPADLDWRLCLNLADRGRHLDRALAVLQQAVEIHRLQIAALGDEIFSARKILDDLHALMRRANASEFACRPALPLLPTAPSTQPDEIRPADGREAQRHQTQGAAAARARRSRAGGDRSNAAHAGDDPGRVRALRLRAG